ncbi:MAG: ferrous iron transport protein B [Eubacteriales bacterium]|jgi:ferrous iron transport protein B
MSQAEMNIAFVGNPNCGKTTLFNAYTGANLKVANWPGVTVEKKEGTFSFHGHTLNLVDLPGIYSLTSYTMEEKLSREYILSSDVDVVIDVADASCLERNLFLTLQLIELGKPVVLALNMMDIVEERGMEIDLHRLPEMLGIPVVPVSARKRTGLEVLMHAAEHHKNRPQDKNLEHHHDSQHLSRHLRAHHAEYVMVYSDEIEERIDLILERLQQRYGPIDNPRWHAIKLLEMDEEIQKLYPMDLSDIVDHSYEEQIINEKYDFIDEIIQEVLVGKSQKAETTDRVDHWLTHPVWGMPIFLCIMALVFFCTFTIGDFLKGYFEMALEIFSGWVGQLLALWQVNDTLTSLIVDGIIAGVGGILTFLPNIFILFLALAFLEDSGYMSRVAYVMDGLMSRMGLSGRAFIPMLLGFGCSVPAVMASRALEDPRDRLHTILVTPFMSCSAKLPVYVLFSQMFFGQWAMLAAFSMYVIGLVMGIVVALILGRVGPHKERCPLLIELPEYKSPNARTIALYVWEKVEDYLSKAGTTIFIASIIVWGLLNFGPGGMVADMSDSFAAQVARLLVPVLAPAGLGLWQVAVALFSGLAAKEVVVSSFSVLFAVTNINSDAGMGQLVEILASLGFGPINAYSLMLFCLLYTPCVATIATVKRETGSWKWTSFLVLFQLVVAWCVSTLFFQVASHLL